MSLADAFEPCESIHRARVEYSTFGHLHPHENSKYHGYIIAAVTQYQPTIVVIKDDFEELENSPWQYSDFHDFVYESLKERDIGVYKYTGWYKKFKNGNYQFQSSRFYKII